MPEYVVSRVAEALNRRKKALNGSRVLVVGVSYKANIDDVRESPSLDVMRLLKRARRRGRLPRPLRQRATTPRSCTPKSESVELTPKALAACDCAVIITGHEGVDYQALLAPRARRGRHAQRVQRAWQSDKIVRL